jgi:hypothetical protein
MQIICLRNKELNSRVCDGSRLTDAEKSVVSNEVIQYMTDFLNWSKKEDSEFDGLLFGVKNLFEYSFA